jgi:c-di-GMP-binding flagellar brake protein YcgR
MSIAMHLHAGIDPERLDEFAVQGFARRVTLLRDIEAAGCLVTVFFGSEEKFVLTSVLYVDPDQGCITFDAGPDAAAMPALLEAGEITASTKLDGIRILFSCGHGEPCLWNRRPAFRTTIPVVMFRMQRREAFRVPAPVREPVMCRIRLDDQGQSLRYRIADLSAKGVSLLVNEPDMPFAPGMVLHDCHMELPGSGTVRGSMKVVRVAKDPVPAHARRRRVACSFCDLPGPTQTMVHKYVLDRQRPR